MEIRIRTYDEVSSERVTIEVAPGQRATIDIVDGEVSTGLASRLYTAAEVGDLQASEAELVATPLRRRIAELERTLAESRELVEFKTRVADDIDADRAELHEKIRDLTAKVREYDHDRKTEQARADQNKEWAKRTEAELARNTAEWEKSSAEGRAQVERLVKRAEEAERQRDNHISALNSLEIQSAEERRMAAQSIAARDSLLKSATMRIEVVRSILAAPQVTETRDGIVTSKGTILSRAIGNALAALDA